MSQFVAGTKDRCCDKLITSHVPFSVQRANMDKQEVGNCSAKWNAVNIDAINYRSTFPSLPITCQRSFFPPPEWVTTTWFYQLLDKCITRINKSAFLQWYVWHLLVARLADADANTHRADWQILPCRARGCVRVCVGALLIRLITDLTSWHPRMVSSL